MGPMIMSKLKNVDMLASKNLQTSQDYGEYSIIMNLTLNNASMIQKLIGTKWLA